MKRLMVITLATILMLSTFASFALAFTMSEKIVVANELIAIARVPAGGFSAQERIDKVNERLAYILGFEPLRPGAIYAVRRGGTRVIMVGSTPLITVTPADADANNTTVEALTRVWLQRAEDAIPEARPAAAAFQ